MPRRLSFSAPLTVTFSANAPPGRVGDGSDPGEPDGRRGQSEGVSVRLRAGERVVRAEPALTGFNVWFTHDGHNVMQMIAGSMSAEYRAGGVSPDGSRTLDYTAVCYLGIRDNEGSFDDHHHGIVKARILFEIDDA